MVGLGACWSGINGSIPMRLWYASDNTTFEEHLYHDDEGEWKWQQSWEGFSGAAGVGCYSLTQNDSCIYAAFVNVQNQAVIYYRTKAGAHLTAGWEKCTHACLLYQTTNSRFANNCIAEAIVSDVYLASAVSLDQISSTTQGSDEAGDFLVSRMTWDGRDTKIQSGQAITLPGRTKGSRFASLFDSDVNTHITFSQTEGSDISQHFRYLNADWQDVQVTDSLDIL
jgi:hypothetical protein